MKRGFKGFYKLMKENLAQHKGKYDEVIDYCPEFFKLLANLLNDVAVTKSARKKICGALAYLAAPLDIVPEQTCGPKGYVDDLFICAYILKKLEKEIGIEILNRYWQGKKELKKAIEESYAKSCDLLNKIRTNQILGYVGLK